MNRKALAARQIAPHAGPDATGKDLAASPQARGKTAGAVLYLGLPGKAVRMCEAIRLAPRDYGLAGGASMRIPLAAAGNVQVQGGPAV